MKFLLFVCVIIAVSFEVCECGWFGGGSKNISSSNGGWFGGGSKSSGSINKPSSSGPSYGWNVGNTQSVPNSFNRFNFGNTAPFNPPPYYPGFQIRPVNSNNNSPARLPPSHPGLQNRPVNSNNNFPVWPPASHPGYQIRPVNSNNNSPVRLPPSHPGLQNRPGNFNNNNRQPVNSNNNNRQPVNSNNNNRQPINSNNNNRQPVNSNNNNRQPVNSNNNNRQPVNSNNNNRQPVNSNNNNRQPSYQTNYHNSHSSPSFGSQYLDGLGSGGFGRGNNNVNNYNGGGGSRSSSGSTILTHGLLYGAGMHHGNSMGRSSSRRWDDEEDRRWKATTKAPYFENKQPGSESVLPAAAVLGAATAFGVSSLLPLNVPNGKPILSCNATEIKQNQINFNGSTYGCMNKTITVSCFKVHPITKSTINLCAGKTLECDKTSDIPNMSCKNGTLFSSEAIFCNSTTILNGRKVNETTKLLNCYAGVLPTNIAASVPTQRPQ